MTRKRSSEKLGCPRCGAWLLLYHQSEDNRVAVCACCEWLLAWDDSLRDFFQEARERDAETRAKTRKDLAGGTGQGER